MASEHEVETTGLAGWIDQRFPMTATWKKHVSEYYAPKNFNFWYFFGSLALLVLVNQIVTGIFLTMNYKPDATLAFSSVEYIMRCEGRYCHTARGARQTPTNSVELCWVLANRRPFAPGDRARVPQTGKYWIQSFSRPLRIAFTAWLAPHATYTFQTPSISRRSRRFSR